MSGPLIVQSDLSLLMEVASPDYGEARDAIMPFAEIVKMPEHIHTWRISDLSLWNAASAGLSVSEMLARLTRYSKFPLPQTLQDYLSELMGRYGRLKLVSDTAQNLILEADEALLMAQIWNTAQVRQCLSQRLDGRRAQLPVLQRGPLKQALIEAGWPLQDLAGYRKQKPLALALKPESCSLRDYQRQAVAHFYRGGSSEGGSGVVVLPCGAGKTIVGMGAMAEIQSPTLILTTSTTAVTQWRRELLDKTNLAPEQIGEYTGQQKTPGPITLSTYQMLTHRRKGESEFMHFELLNTQSWGLIIYDEVHVLPARIFRFASSLQAVRRLGLTATLIREDGRAGDVFALIGPKVFDLPWKLLEAQGWIAPVRCVEVRVAMDSQQRFAYASASGHQRGRLAAENPAKIEWVGQILRRHPDLPALIIGQYLEQLQQIAAYYDLPLLTGKSPAKQREKLFGAFRQGEIQALVVSSIANFAIDLPEAQLAIQVSGKFGSRQEEAQRLGRLLRPKGQGQSAHFYSLVSRESKEQKWSLKRQLFLVEQGYQYEIQYAGE